MPECISLRCRVMHVRDTALVASTGAHACTPLRTLVGEEPAASKPRTRSRLTQDGEEGDNTDHDEQSNENKNQGPSAKRLRDAPGQLRHAGRLALARLRKRGWDSISRLMVLIPCFGQLLQLKPDRRH